MDTLRIHAKGKCTCSTQGASLRRFVVGAAAAVAFCTGGVVHADVRNGQPCRQVAELSPRGGCNYLCPEARGTATFTTGEADPCTAPPCPITPNLTFKNVCEVPGENIVAKLCLDDGNCQCPDSPGTITLTSGEQFQLTPEQWDKFVGGFYVVHVDMGGDGDADASGIATGKGKPAVPTLSGWGMVVMTLLLLTGIKITFGRRRAA